MNIKKKIQQQGMTLAMVAEKMNIKAPTLSTIINNKNPKYESLQKIADALGITVSELVSESEENKTATIHCPHCGKPITIEAKDGTIL
ncbi:MAG: helix-turn-helix transcriptional regulator [Prevotella sp.]|nr:helix-turn-helix transcriptional regulator [Prevotella sp.]